MIPPTNNWRKRQTAHRAHKRWFNVESTSDSNVDSTLENRSDLKIEMTLKFDAESTLQVQRWNDVEIRLNIGWPKVENRLKLGDPHYLVHATSITGARSYIFTSPYTWRCENITASPCDFNNQILPYGILFLAFINTDVFYLLSFKFSC